MGKIDKMEQARREGMSYALRVAKEQGVDGLEQELERRNASGLPIAYKRETLQEAWDNVKMQTLDMVCLVAEMVLRDEFDFGKARLERFRKRFDFKSGCLLDGFVTIEDMQEALKKETGIYKEIFRNDKDVRQIQETEKIQGNRRERRAMGKAMRKARQK